MIRIYTEDKNREGIRALLDNDFDGYTIIPAIGRWRGQDEKSLVIEVSGEPESKVEEAAREIKTINGQESVMVADDIGEREEFV